MAKINADGSVYTNHITGKLAFDESQSCSYEDGELPLGGWKIKATSLQNTYATTLHDGSFWLSTNDDSVLLSTVLPNACWTNCPEPVYALFSTPSDTTHVELFVQATKNCPTLEVSASAPFLRRCFNNTYTIHCENTGTIPSQNTQLKVYLDPFFEYVNASVPLVSQNGVEYIFEVGTLDVGESYTFHLSVTVSCDAELGQEHCLSVIAVADNTCPEIDNSLARTRECQPNIGSFDPNDKRAFSEGKLIERFIAADSLIEYQIRFQNTGTDTAFTVVIADTLSSLLDIESIRAGASSHAYRMELAQNNILKFVFNDIMLPDSNVNEPASNGFVKFSIRHKPGLVPGDVIPNKAAIFFDFNEAVITNNLELEIEDPTSVGHARQPIGQRVLVYPQPAHDVVVFERLDESRHQSCRLQIMNLLGQVIYDQPMSGAVLRVQGLPTGQHFYRLRQNGETLAVGKLVVAK
ncbi:MAG: T9SS type A sorting domain-containing protein [Saprospiraceae bacterium]|nr:T9SS type A sorting domain-containing protein [Saprospiraceae bacterium]